jgi:hypothetical protein
MSSFVPHRSRHVARYTLPNGGAGRVHRHRVFRNPNGQLQAQPMTARGKRSVMVRQVPASYSSRPTGTSGAWVQLSSADQTAGLLHIPGRPPESVFVERILSVGGETQAIVRQRFEVNPQQQAAVVHQAPVRVVSTRTMRRRNAPRAEGMFRDFGLTKPQVEQRRELIRDFMGLWSLNKQKREAAIRRLLG